ncbi:hypothetical protein [Legionella fairfieldensis]|uniref:hypothetical protein n=1 Tax=Legionella fairfieldensis TaxID=45064 RepID=UPI000491EE58|nr:hypothetical protein [Legionella fairfieldensis]
MKIKSTIAGLIISISMIGAAGAAQAACSTHCPVQEGFSGTGWHMVPCNSNIQPAQTWQQYVSGGYAPPVTGQSNFFLLPLLP